MSAVKEARWVMREFMRCAASWLPEAIVLVLVAGTAVVIPLVIAGVLDYIAK